MTVFQESVIVQVLILLTLWGFAIDTLVRRRRERKPTTPPNPNAARATAVLIWICAGVVLFFVVIGFLASVTS
ncbi:hypothetical protein CH249_14605 [Rhodococcus sp. 05-2255-3B1]|uniref:hypothetical protein n=1 Tax=unclassified Rhodococcus (in: high G+C Gram-positive bacteria) TaxID=192944 RepID=UPI000B9BA3B0|nr:MULTISPECIES: hypothetical protein [unclassified Rhodococcus (in: high G+C Gram-positive bacteria)]OZE03044.1 hypothetical protein CH250_22670 [Rhodococcus sp. 05-2255-3C]OZE09434.1 hypothetical protein CH249_14605 [Rhodococcus sp. 05-2255-3B1]